MKLKQQDPRPARRQNPKQELKTSPGQDSGQVQKQNLTRTKTRPGTRTKPVHQLLFHPVRLDPQNQTPILTDLSSRIPTSFCAINQIPLVYGSILKAEADPASKETWAWAAIDPADYGGRLEKTETEKGIDCFVLKDALRPQDPFQVFSMPLQERTCFLMNTSMITESWCREFVRPCLHPQDQVCVLAMSYFDDTKTLSDWNRQYDRVQGMWYKANTDVFKPFGIPETNVHWINPFTQEKKEMLQILSSCHVLMLPGGAPDLFYKRMKQAGLMKVLKHWQGVVIGYSAGAMVQLDRYPIIPDEDYDCFGWYPGLGYHSGFSILPHFQPIPHQMQYVRRITQETGKPLYGIYEKGGIRIGKDGQMTFFGKVDLF